MITIRQAKPEGTEILSQLAISARCSWNYTEHWRELWKPQLILSPMDFEEHESWVAEKNGEHQYELDSQPRILPIMEMTL